MKKIIFILPSLRGGGAEKVFINLAHYFGKKEYPVELVTLKADSDYQCNFEYLKIKFVCFNKKRSVNSFFKLFWYLKKTNSRVIFSTIAHVNIMLFIINIFLNKKIIFRESNNTDLNFKNLNFFKKFFFNYFQKKISKSNTVVYPSYNLKNDILKRNKIINTNKIVINNPISIKLEDSIDIKILKKIKNIKDGFEKIIINVGSFTKQKNHKDLINVFSNLDNIDSKCLILIGNGPLKKEINTLLNNLGIQKNVFIFNFQNNLMPFFNISDLYVSTSLWEGFPNVLLDAAIFNVPIIAYNCNYGPSEILENGKFGKLCKPGDKNSLLKLINSGLAGSIKKIPRQYLLEKYSLESIGKKYEDLI